MMSAQVELLLPIPNPPSRDYWCPGWWDAYSVSNIHPCQVVVKVKDWDRGPGVDDPLGMTSVDLKNLGMQGDVAEMLMDLKSTKANKGQVSCSY